MAKKEIVTTKKVKEEPKAKATEPEVKETPTTEPEKPVDPKPVKKMARVHLGNAKESIASRDDLTDEEKARVIEHVTK